MTIDPLDPFKPARESDGFMSVRADDQDLTMLLKLKDVRKAAKDWKSFSSDHPLRGSIHSEAEFRSVRQLPLETDPPEHTDYRALVEPLFRRPMEADYIQDMEELVSAHLADAIEKKEVEVVKDFALPLQSHALTRLFGLPASEADEWISWGIHVFYDSDRGVEDGHFLERYSARKFAEAEKNPGDDFFSHLNHIEYRGRKLTFEEKQGFANVALSGGRDTVIKTIVTILIYVAENPDTLDFLREDPQRILTATEEFIRYISPLSTIARSCPHAVKVGDREIPAGGRVALCWPSANRDREVFKDPDKVILDRSPNPHVGFGFGPHSCLGAQHARLIIRSLLKSLCHQVDSLEVLSVVPNMEVESSFKLLSGYKSVHVRFSE